MDEAELCDRIALLQDGQLLSVDTPNKIKEDYPVKLWAVRAENMYQLKADLAVYDDTRSVFLFGQYLHVTLNQDGSSDDLSAWLDRKGHHKIHVEGIQPSVEDCFMELMTKNQLQGS